MPPFQYRTFQDPYVGDITRLMGAGPEAQARSIREVGNIRAQEAQQKGAITAGLVGNLTQMASTEYDRYKERKADEAFQRLVDKKTQASYAAVGEDRMRPTDFSKMPQGPRTYEDIFGDRPPEPATSDDVPQTGAQWDQRYGGVSLEPGPSPAGQMGEIVDSPGSPSLSQGKSLIPGMIEEGNIDLYAQPVVQNPDGSTSTVDSVGWDEEVNGRTVHVLVPQVTPDGRHFTDPREAWKEYKRTGLHLGKFESEEASTAYGGQLHDEYESGLYDREPLPEAPEVPPAVPEEPDTQTMAGLLGTGTPEPLPRLYEHVFDDGRFDVKTLPTALAREGVSREQIDRLMGRAVEYNAAVTAQNDETRARGLEERLLQKDRLLSRLLLQDEDPSLEMVLSIPGVSPQEAVTIHNTIRAAKQAQINLENAQGENFVPDAKAILALARLFPDEESGNMVVNESMRRIEETGNLSPQLVQVAQQITTMERLENFLTQYEGIGAASPTFEERRNQVFAELEQAIEEFGENHPTVQALTNKLARINAQENTWQGRDELPAVKDPETQPEEYDRLSREQRGLQTELAALADPESPEGLTLAREIESLGAQMAQITEDVRDYATQIKPDEEGDRDINATLEALGFNAIPNRQSVVELLSSDAAWLNPTSGPWASLINLIGSTPIIGDMALRRDGGEFDEWGGPEAIERTMGQRKRLAFLERHILAQVLLSQRFPVTEVKDMEKKIQLMPRWNRSTASILVAVKEIDQDLRVKLKEAALDDDHKAVTILVNLINDLGVSPGGETEKSPSNLEKPPGDPGLGMEWTIKQTPAGPAWGRSKVGE